MSRGGMSFRAAAGAVAVLFARSHERAAAIHQAMLARGFQSRFIPLSPPKFGAADALFTAGVISAVLVLRLASEGVA
jgi:energy-coupling factor transporter transmembrane protein EcfT